MWRSLASRVCLSVACYLSSPRPSFWRDVSALRDCPTDQEVADDIAAVPTHRAAKVFSNAGGNWSANGAWVGGSPAVNGDTVTATGTSGNVVVDVASACTSIILTNYVGTLTFNSTLTVAGTVTFVAGMTIAGTAGTLICSATSTLTSAGKTLTCALTLSGAGVTYTLADTWTVNGLVTTGSTTTQQTLNQTTTQKITCAGGYTHAATSGNLIGTAKLSITGGTWSYTGGSSGSTEVNVDLAGNVTIGTTVNYGITGVTLAYVSGTITTTSSTLALNTCTLATSGVTWNNVTIGSAATITINSTLSATGTMTLPNAAITFAGTAGWTVGTLTTLAYTASRIVTLTFGNTYKVTTTLTNVATTNAIRQAFKSGTPGSKVIFTLTPGASQDLIYADPTDIDSSAGATITSMSGVITTTFNWNNVVTPMAPNQGLRSGGAF
jgi:hypothetical protein